jgi:UDP-galactose transporter B1
MKALLLLAALLPLAAAITTPRDASAAPALGLRRKAPPSSQASGAVVQRPALRGGGSSFEMPSSVAMAIGAAGIFVSFSFFAVLQEDIYKKTYGGEKFAFTFFVLVMDRLINGLSAWLGVSLLGKSGLNIPYLDIFYSGVSQMLAMAASNEALRYVSYPTQVLGKSCKMVPVMAGGIVLGGKRYSLVEYLQVALITRGLCVLNFGANNNNSGPADSPFGLALIGLSLVMDMVTGGLQDKVKQSTKELNPMAAGPKRPSMHESMLWTNVSGFLVAFLLALLTGHLFGGIAFCAKHPQLLWAIIVYSLCSAVGGNFVYFTLTQFNPLVLTTVTTVRKIFSTLFSIFRNPNNALSPMQWSGTMLVFGGLLGDIVRKLIKKPSTPPPPPPPPAPPLESASEEASPKAE